MSEVEPNLESQAQPEPPSDMETLLSEETDYGLPRPGDLRLGKVIQIGSNGAVVSIGFKHEGLVDPQDLEEMRRAGMPEVNVGDEVPVLVLRSDESEGYVALSIYKARLAEDWIRAEQLLASGELYEGRISGYNRGGLTVQFGRLRGFVPISQIYDVPRRATEVERRALLQGMVGQTVGLRVIEVDRRRRRLIFSERQAHRAWQRVRRKRLLEELQPGERRSGRVSSIADFGVFVDLGGADGLVHLSELSWGRAVKPQDLVRQGDRVDVVVLDVDRERGRIALSMKQAQEDPWATIEQRYHVDDLREGVVTQVSPIGAFVELEPGVEGLLHVSELVGAPAVAPEDVLHPGDEVLVKIIRVEKERRRLGLSARRVRREEWEQWALDKAAREAARAEEPVAEEMPSPVAEEEEPLPEDIEVEAAGLEAEPFPEEWEDEDSGVDDDDFPTDE